jgi:hypothetical protein
MKSLTRAIALSAGLLLAGTSQAASLYLSPSSISPTGVGIVPATADVILDLTGVTSQGGGVELDFSGVVSFTAFTPSAFFNSKNTDDTGTTDFTGYGDPPGAAELEIFIGDFAGITGVNSLGTLFFNVAAGSPGAIALAASPSNRWGTFVDLNGNPIAGFAFGNIAGKPGVGAEVVPLPATAWLFATGMGLAGFWRRRR